MLNNLDFKKEMSFDSSLSSIDNTISSNDYISNLVSLLQPILNNRFKDNYGKKDIRVYKDRISFACPYCGDSMKSDHKKRGNIIIQGKFKNFFKCHNCDEFKRVDKFFSDFKVTLDLSVINYITENINNFSYYNDEKYDMSSFLDIELIDKYALDRQEFLKTFGLIEVKNSNVWPWLKARLQYDDQKFMYNPKFNYLVILNLTPSGKIIGLQKRLFSGVNKYKTYKFSKIYEILNKPVDKFVEEIDIISTIFNIFYINYAKSITLFEGPFDAFLFKNSIANTGANKALPIDINVRYFYDDDKTGRKKSIEKINEGEEVFLWTKLKTDLELPNRNKWDLNDVLIYLNKNNIPTPNFNDYFSDNELDIIDI